REDWRKPCFDIELVASGGLRPGDWGEEGGLRELPCPLNQSNETWRVMRDSGQPQLVAFDTQLGDIGVVWQNLRKDLKSDDGRRRGVLALSKGALSRRGWIIGRVTCRQRDGSSLGDVSCELILAGLEFAVDDGSRDAGCRGHQAT